MRRVALPAISTADALDACLPHRRRELRDRLEAVRDELINSEAVYIEHANAQTLFQIAAANNVSGIVTGNEMESLYTGTFARQKTASRALYDKLKQGAPNGICPLCGGQQVKTLDHYLAKTVHAPFTVTPCNLVPACSDCNKAKLNHQAVGAGDQHLHPYFDDVDDATWLFANVVEASPPSMIYFVAAPVAWPHFKRERVERHFEALNHGHLFAALSSDHLPSMRNRLRRIFDKARVEGVREHLAEDLESHRAERRNSWQIAMFAALLESDWYCSGGFDA